MHAARGAEDGWQRRLDLSNCWGHRRDIYYIDISVGTPAQIQSVIVDTGSTLTAFACENSCQSCGTHLDVKFNEQGSSTLEDITDSSQCVGGNIYMSGGRCQYTVTYVGGGQIQGYLFRDTVSIGRDGSNSGSTATLGCHITETGGFLTQAPNGIMGLGADTFDVLTALAGGHLEERVVGLCLGRHGGALVAESGRL